MITKIQKQTKESIRTICDTLAMPRSSYYHAATPTPSAVQDKRIGTLIETIFREHRRRYGYRRIYQELQDHGVQCSQERVRRIMRQRGLRSLYKRSFVPQTSDGKATAPAPNLLKDRKIPERADEVWTGDITYIPSASGWLYLAVVIDLFSRKIIGWQLSDHMRSEMVLEALDKALETRERNQKELIFHSDRGSQYGSKIFRKRLAQSGIVQSMSAKANPYDNAWTESFMGTLKAEMLGDGQFESIEDAQAVIFEYIDSYYNTKRKHSSLGYKSPSQFEQKARTLTIPLLTK